MDSYKWINTDSLGVWVSNDVHIIISRANCELNLHKHCYSPLFTKQNSACTSSAAMYIIEVGVHQTCAPAGSPVWRPELLGDSFRPGEASLLALGVRPKRPAARKMAVEEQIICTAHHAQSAPILRDIVHPDMPCQS